MIQCPPIPAHLALHAQCEVAAPLDVAHVRDEHQVEAEEEAAELRVLVVSGDFVCAHTVAGEEEEHLVCRYVDTRH